MIRALLFDLGNVLLCFSHERMWSQIGRLAGLTADQVRQRLFDGELMDVYERGRVSTAELVGELNRRLGRRIDPALFAQAASDIFWTNESMVPVIESLSRAGWPLVLVSNVCEVHMKWIDQHFDIVRHFRRRALSFEVGSRKPERRIFEVAAELAGARPAECFFTDDIAEHVAGAARLGFDAWRYTDTPSLVRQLAERGVRV